MNGEIRVVDDLAAAFTELVELAFESRTSDRFSFACSGGSSANLYPQLTASKSIDWRLVDLFFGDERCVPRDDDMSNFKLIQEKLLSHLDTQPAVFPMNYEDGPDAYEFLLRVHGPLDFIHLGVGPDGHTASVFPDSKADGQSDRLVLENEDIHGVNPLKRETLTLTAINQARNAVLTLAGESKQSIVNKLKEDDSLPAAKVNAKETIWLLDRAAAGE